MSGRKMFTLKLGRDYFETYAPVIRLSTLNMLFSVAASKYLWAYHDVDFQTAFLKGPIDAPVFMECPVGFPIQMVGFVNYAKA